MCAWFTGLTVLTCLYWINVVLFLFAGSVSHCEREVIFSFSLRCYYLLVAFFSPPLSPRTKLCGWCSGRHVPLDVLSVGRSPFCRHAHTHTHKKPLATIRIAWCSGTLVINARRRNGAPLFASSVQSWALRRPWEQPRVWLLEFLSRIVLKLSILYLGGNRACAGYLFGFILLSCEGKARKAGRLRRVIKPAFKTWGFDAGGD